MARNHSRIGRGGAQDRGRSTRNMARRAVRVGRARRHFPQARPPPRAAVHLRQRRDDAGGDRRQRRHRLAAGTLGVMGAYAKGAPVRIIGAESTGEDSYWYVRADSPVKSMADMKGRTMAYSTNGSSTHANALAFVELYKVDAKLIATGGFPATFTMVMSG